jgi:hypothetical protein
VPADKEKRALAGGEALGFTPGEPTEFKQGKGRVMRRHERTPTRSLLYPGSVLHRFVYFVAYANELNADAYWKVLDKLLSEKGK